MKGATALAVVLVVLSLAITVAALALFVATNEPIHPNIITGLVAGATFPIVGALVASRRRRNPIGWLFLVIGLTQTFNILCVTYADYGLVTHPGSLPLAGLMSWLAMWMWAPGLILLPIALLLFPNGHHPSPRWRYATIFALVAMGLLIVPMAVVAWPLRGVVLVNANSGADVGPVSSALPFQAAGLIMGMLAAIASLVSLISRWRRSQDIEREQLKWLAFAVVVVIPIYVAQQFLPADSLFSTVMPNSIVLVPIAIGVAILRYRLYDIDRIINRTLVYVLLTAILAGVYAGSISLSQRVMAATGQKSDAAIVLTALVVATLFTPLKNTLQARVDRRFKEVHDPRMQLAELAAIFETRVWTAEPTASLQRLLDVSLSAFGASGGSVSLAGRAVARSGNGDSGGALTASAGDGEARITLAIEARSNGQPYTDDDRRALEPTVVAIARALTH